MALLPDPTPRERQHILISVDDHVIEPPDMFDGRLPAALADRAPDDRRADDGSQVWRYEDREYPNIGLNAVIGRPKEEWSMEPARFDEMRRGCWDIDARIADMDLAGIWASLNFPSLIAGFAGTVFWKSDDPELGLAVLAGVERLAPRGVGRRLPGPHHPAAAARGSPTRSSPPKSCAATPSADSRP